jgi:hypothetical protein
MRLPHLPALVLALAAILCSPADLAPALQPAGGQAPDAATQSQPMFPSVTLDFAGGSVEKYVSEIRRVIKGHPVNIVVSRAALKVELAPIRLDSASLEAAVQAIRTAAGQDTGLWDISVLPSSSGAQGALLSVDVRSPRQPIQSAGDNADLQRMEVLSLRQLIETQPGDPPGAGAVLAPDVVLSAVEAAITLGGNEGEGKPEVKFHKDSGLLIVRAGPTTLRAVVSAVETMRKDVLKRREQASTRYVSPEALAEARAQVKRSRVAMEIKAGEVERARARLDEVEALVKAGSASTRELSDARAAAEGAMGAMRLAEVELERAEEVAAGLDRAGGGAAAEEITATLAVPRPVAIGAIYDAYRAAATGVCKAEGVKPAFTRREGESQVALTGPRAAVERTARILGAIADELVAGQPAGGGKGGEGGR